MTPGRGMTVRESMIMPASVKWLCFAAVCALTGNLHAQGHVIIGSWNIEQLSDRSRQNPAALAQHIQASGVDVLALQEIHDTDDSPSAIRNVKLDRAFERIRKQTGQSWRYILHPEREGATRNQHIGVAWNAGKLTRISDPYPVPVEYANRETWKRTPYAVKFQSSPNKTDFVIISLHMKSNYPVGGLPPPPELRGEEARSLVRQLQKVKERFQDEDIILLGDSNCLEAGEEALKILAKAGWRDLNGDDAVTYRKAGYNSPFDRIFVPDEPEFRYTYQYVQTPTNWKKHLDRFSDHWLIKAAIHIQDDDD